MVTAKFEVLYNLHFDIIVRNMFRIASNMYDEAFLENS